VLVTCATNWLSQSVSQSAMQSVEEEVGLGAPWARRRLRRGGARVGRGRPARARKGGSVPSLLVLARIEGDVWLAARELQQHAVVFGRSTLGAEEGGCCARSATNLQNQG
jgi:hypothetical protein